MSCSHRQQAALRPRPERRYESPPGPSAAASHPGSTPAATRTRSTGSRMATPLKSWISTTATSPTSPSAQRLHRVGHARFPGDGHPRAASDRSRSVGRHDATESAARGTEAARSPHGFSVRCPHRCANRVSMERKQRGQKGAGCPTALVLLASVPVVACAAPRATPVDPGGNSTAGTVRAVLWPRYGSCWGSCRPPSAGIRTGMTGTRSPALEDRVQQLHARTAPRSSDTATGRRCLDEAVIPCQAACDRGHVTVTGVLGWRSGMFAELGESRPA